MIRPVLLAALVVCSLGAPFVAVQPAAGDVLSETPDDSDDSDDADREASDRETPDDSDGDSQDDGDDDRRWYDRWRSDDENRSVDEDDTDERSDEANSTETRDGETDETDRDTNETDRETNETDRETNETDENDQHDARNESASEDRWNVTANATSTLNATERVLDVARGTVRGVTDGAPTVGDGDVDVDDGPLGSSAASSPDHGVAPAVNDASLERSVGLRADALLPAATYGALRGVNGTLSGVLDGSPLLLTFEERYDRGDGDEPSAGNASVEPPADDDARAGSAGGEARGDASPSSVAAVAAPLDRDGASDRDDGAGADGGEPAGSPAGAGAALFVTVGCLGGSRVAVTQASLLTSPGVDGTLSTFRRVAGEHLAGLPDRVVPPVFGYSRHDSSDPLENETRAEIYDLVCESPGIYHARLAEETGVAVETVRYHCRILAEEGLVEPRKHRGKRRLYPVSMDDDDPDLAAAIADSAAADVLSAIERLEPATLSAVAEHVDCAPSTVAYHLDRLEEDGLVSRERDGGAVQVRLRRSTRSALQGTVADD